ncbi:hypothetical protein KUTeg_020986 [Tegillarca granosa]|uniref:Uncharacterized protein n=1 Tax=Tegillarca granosa TaxID=220873 RepID=A0ABQ9E9G6_TEGGR|nr:hypothetical protein KUTeg_020986 [Tegillarca granosa]
MGLTISSLFTRLFGKKNMRILMVDSNDRERVTEAQEELMKMLNKALYGPKLCRNKYLGWLVNSVLFDSLRIESGMNS